MSKFYKVKFEPDKHYLLKICSLEKRYIYYRNNFKRLCIENQKLKKQNEDLTVTLDRYEKEIKNLENELEYYKDNIIEDLENRDRWE